MVTCCRCGGTGGYYINNGMGEADYDVCNSCNGNGKIKE